MVRFHVVTRPTAGFDIIENVSFGIINTVYTVVLFLERPAKIASLLGTLIKVIK